MSERILLATDGTDAAAGAVRLTLDRVGADSDAVRVISVVEPFVLYGVGAAYPAPLLDGGIEPGRIEGLEAAVRDQIREVAGGEVAWTVAVEIGAPAPTIVRSATEFGATLIVTGIGEHSRADRWMGTETALDVIRMANLPVCAAHPALRGRPHRAVVAIDFSDFSLEAARAAARILADDGELHLVHVLWPRALQSQEWGATYAEGARARLEGLGRSITGATRLATHFHLPQGDATRVVLELVSSTGADLVAAGSHGYGFFGRLVMGSISTGLLRGADCSVLIAPATARAGS